MPGCLHDRCGKPASALKDVYLETRNLRSYLTLCERFVLTPLDCEKIATLLKTKKRFTEALTWVERGLKAEGQRNWHNESSHTLRFLKQELLAKVGRREEALQQACKDFIVAPSKDGYDDLMRYASKGERQDWHRRALGQAERSGLWGFIDICVKTREWERLAGRVLAVGDGELEGLSHYTTEPAAKGLVRKSPEAAAKLYRALALRILKAGKSKYYAFALEHLRTRGGCTESLAATASGTISWQKSAASIHANVASWEPSKTRVRVPPLPAARHSPSGHDSGGRSTLPEVEKRRFRL